MCLHSTRVHSGHARKFKKPWTGPYRVLQHISDQVYKIKHVHTSKLVHFDRLKPCNNEMHTGMPRPSVLQSLTDFNTPNNGTIGSNIEVIEVPAAPSSVRTRLTPRRTT